MIEQARIEAKRQHIEDRKIPLPPNRDVENFSQTSIKGEPVLINPENPAEQIDQKLIDIGEKIAALTGTWNPVEIYTPSAANVAGEKEKFFEAYDRGDVYLPDFQYDVAEKMGNMSAIYEELFALQTEVFRFKNKLDPNLNRVIPLTPREELVRRALIFKIRDDMKTCRMVEGIQQKDDEKVRDALDSKYPRLDEEVLAVAHKRYTEMTQPGPEPERLPAVLTPEQQKLIENAEFSQDDLKDAVEWMLKGYGILRTDENPDGFRIEMSDRATKFDVRDKSTEPMTIYIPQNSDKTSGKDLLRLLVHEVEAHARMSMNGKKLLGFGGGALRFDNERLYEGLAMRNEAFFNRELFGIDEATNPPWSPPFDILIMEAATKGANFAELFKMSLEQRLRTVFKVPEGQSLEDVIAENKVKDPEGTAKKIEKAKKSTWLVVHKNMRGHTDPTNKASWGLTKDVAYVGGYLDDQKLQAAGNGFVNEVGIVPNSGLEMMAKLDLSEKDLPHPFLNLTKKFCFEVMLPKLEAEAAAKKTA